MSLVFNSTNEKSEFYRNPLSAEAFKSHNDFEKAVSRGAAILLVLRDTACKARESTVSLGQFGQQRRILGRAHAAADREGDCETVGDALHELHERRAVADGRLDVEEHELVRSRIRVERAQLDRVADVAQRAEAHALHDPAARDVETRDQTRERDKASSR